VSITLILFILAFMGLSVLAFLRPAWGVSLYFLTFFACPTFWWWGKEVAHYRWNFYGGVGLLLSVLISRTMSSGSPYADSPQVKRLFTIAIIMLVNCTLVHFLLARNMQVSFGSYELAAKFLLLFFMIAAAIRTPADFKIILFTMIVGAGYIGWEATINDRGKLKAGRLEGVGAPGARGANELASLCVSVIPLAGAFFMGGNRYQKVAAFLITPFILNVILLCNSRGAFLSLIACAFSFAGFAPGKVRRRAFKLLFLGGIAVYLLLNDPHIIERFMSTFVGTEELDDSASSRLTFWKAGFRMIADYPLGAGGNGFKKVHGGKYITEVNDEFSEGRAVHNGYINEACEWGIQGLLLKVAFLGFGFLTTFQTVKMCSRQNRINDALYGCGILAGMVAFMGTCMFGDRLDAEWGYWLVALAVGYTRLYGIPFENQLPVAQPQMVEPQSPGIYYQPTA